MFSPSVALNRNVSCGTKPISRRSASGSRSRTSTPSTVTRPLVGSSNRGIRFTSVLFPLPVCPTIATVLPPSDPQIHAVERRRRAETHFHVFKFQLAPHRLAELQRPWRRGDRRLLVQQLRDALPSTRVPRCIRFTTHPSAIIGHTSIPMYVLNITKLPERNPARQQLPPAHPQHDQERQPDQRLQQRHEQRPTAAPAADSRAMYSRFNVSKLPQSRPPPARTPAPPARPRGSPAPGC